MLSSGKANSTPHPNFDVTYQLIQLDLLLSVGRSVSASSGKAIA